MKFLKHLLSLVLIMTLIFKLPQVHYNYIRNSVGNQVVKITNERGNSGGTGFNIKAPSGKTYILTNSHVCSHVSQEGLVYVHDSQENILQRRVLLNSNFTDLCVVEAMPGASGMSLGSEPQPGEIVAVVGHPKLMPNTMSRGEIIGTEDLQVMDHLMDPSDETDKCDLPKNKIEEASIFGIFRVQICTVKIKAYLSTVIILPGSSGSPVVNFFGNVVAVAFAGDSDSNWGSFVTLPDIKQILKPF
jgi:S1-C subfamily serine protease